MFSGKFSKKIDLIKMECEIQGRDFSKIDLSLETQILIRETEEEIEECLSEYSKLIKQNNSFGDDILAQLKATNPNEADFNLSENIKKEFLVGTPNNIKAKLDQYIAKGVNHFMLWFMDYPDNKGIDLFAKSIFPNYK